jgi:hypothetical protein
MAFDAAFAAPQTAAPARPRSLDELIEAAGVPDRTWAAANPEALLAFLFVAPQPCEALDDLLGA